MWFSGAIWSLIVGNDYDRSRARHSMCTWKQKSSVGFTWRNERLAGFMLHLLWVHCTATLAECTNFHFWSHGGRHRGLRLWTIDGDYHDNPSRLTLMWREGKAGEPIKFPSLINRIHACAYEMILVIHARSWSSQIFFCFDEIFAWLWMKFFHSSGFVSMFCC